MATVSQIQANRQNSLKSTGPQSAEGKAVVAKNAVKHGLFAHEAVITGENREDYELFHDEFLAELAPAGAMESVLAERIVSLSWRLQRAERIQNQAFDVMIAKDEPSPMTQHLKKTLPPNMQDAFDDPRGREPELVLGRVAIKNLADSRSMERLSLYERRIENSLHKTIRELDRRKIMRQIELQNAQNTPAEYERTDHPHPFGMRLPHERDNVKREEVAALEGTNLKKQSQLTTAEDRSQETEDSLKKQSQFLKAGHRIQNTEDRRKGSKGSQLPTFGRKSEPICKSLTGFTDKTK